FFQSLGENWYFWVGLWVGYFVFIVVGAGLLLWRQRTKTSIYNVQPDAFMEAFLQVCEALDLELVSSGQHFALRSRQNAEKADGLVSASQHVSTSDSVGTPQQAPSLSWQA